MQQLQLQLAVNALSTLTNGLYTVAFTASDNAGNSKSKNQQPIVDKSIPSTTLIGNQAIEHPRGAAFIDPGVAAFDAKGVDLTENVTSENDINVNLGGSYSAIYRVSDSFGNSISTSRIINAISRLRVDDVER